MSICVALGGGSGSALVGCNTPPKILPPDPTVEAAGSAAPAPATSVGPKTNTSTGAPSSGVAASTASNSNAAVAEDAVPSAAESYGWVKFEHTPFGTGNTPNAQLRRQLQVTLLGESAMIGKGYVMRSSLTTQYVDIALAITNTDPELRCFVKAESIVWKTADGDVIPGDTHEMMYVSGSVGNSVDSPTMTCLGPGEKGYFLAIQMNSVGDAPIFEALSEIELTLSASKSSFERPGYRVLPTNWKGSADHLEITFKNVGAAPAPIEIGQGEFIFTDENGLPLSWGFLDLTTGLTKLGGGESLHATADIYFEGKASNMLVAFGY